MNALYRFITAAGGLVIVMAVIIGVVTGVGWTLYHLLMYFESVFGHGSLKALYCTIAGFVLIMAVIYGLGHAAFGGDDNGMSAS